MKNRQGTPFIRTSERYQKYEKRKKACWHFYQQAFSAR